MTAILRFQLSTVYTTCEICGHQIFHMMASECSITPDCEHGIDGYHCMVGCVCTTAGCKPDRG